MPKRGGKRTKKRTHVLQSTESQPAEEKNPIPKSMVIRAPRSVLPHTLQVLQTEIRKVMSPYTAQKLKEKKSNSLKDYTHVAGLLMITHFLFLSPGGKRSPSEASSGGVGSADNVAGAGALLKIGRFPQGPTLTFRINQYSLCRHIRATQKKSYDVAALYNSPPLVVLNNFGAEGAPAPGAAPVPAHIKLMRITFQNMFPALDVATVKLTDCRRVVLFSYDKDANCVEMRHYAIRAAPVAVSKPIKRVICSNSKQLPDLGHLDDISDWLLRQQSVGDASDSEAEDEDTHVVLPQKVQGRGNHAQQQAAVKLSELGPRLNLRLLKVERGFCEGDVMYHAIEKRTPEEVALQRSQKNAQEAAKRSRREEQESNVARKTIEQEEARRAKRSRFQPRSRGASDDEPDE